MFSKTGHCYIMRKVFTFPVGFVLIAVLDYCMFRSVVFHTLRPDLNNNTEFGSLRHNTVTSYDSEHESLTSLACRVPRMDPYHAEIRQYIYVNKPLKCPGRPPLTYVNNDYLVINISAAIKHYGRTDQRVCI